MDGKRAREEAEGPPTHHCPRPGGRWWQPAPVLLGTCPHARDRKNLGTHLACSSSSAFSCGQLASEGLQSMSPGRVYCMLGPFPQRSQNLPLNFPSTTLPLHSRILDHSTSSHPRAFAQALPPFLLCLIGIVTPARMNLCVFPRHLAHTRR